MYTIARNKPGLDNMKQPHDDVNRAREKGDNNNHERKMATAEKYSGTVCKSLWKSNIKSLPDTTKPYVADLTQQYESE